MSLKMVTPITITDSIVRNTIAEPDALQGEVEWQDRKVPAISAAIDSSRNNGMCVTDDGVIYYVGNGIYYISDTGVQIQVVESLAGDFADCAYYDGFVYVSRDAGSDLYVVDVSDNSVQLLAGIMTNRAFCAVSGDNGFIYFGGAGIISSYEIATQTVSTLAVSDDSADVEIYSGVLGIDGNIYFTGYNVDINIYKVISFSPEAMYSEFISKISRAGLAITQGIDGLLYSAGRGSIAITNPATGDVSFFGAIGGAITDLITIPNGDILAVGISTSGFAKISVIDTSSQTVVQVIESIGAIPRINGGVYADGAAWFCGNAGLTGSILDRYEEEEQVVLSSTHLIYQASTNTYDNPEDGVLLTVPSWVEVSATNKYRAYDYKISTKSIFSPVAVNNAQVIMEPKQAVTSLSFYGLDRVTSIITRIWEDDENGTLIYSKTVELAMDSPDGDDLVNDTLLADKLLLDDLPTYSNPYIFIIFRTDDDTCEVGDIVIGNPRTFGVALYQSSTSRTSYNTVEYDTFGSPSIVQRPSAEYVSFEVAVFPEYADYVERILKDSLDEIRVWVAEKPDGEKLFTIGYYERSPIIYSSPSKYDTTLKIRGLT